MAQNKYDPSRLLMMQELRPDEEVPYRALADGKTLFPVRAKYLGTYDDGPLLRMTFGILDGRAVCFSMAVEAGMESRGGTATPGGLTGSMVHEIPAGLIIEDMLGRCASGTLAMVQAGYGTTSVPPFRSPTPEEYAATSRAARGSRRGRPVSDAELIRTAEIVREDPFAFRAKVQAEMYVSARTASRYAELARQRGFLTEDDK